MCSVPKWRWALFFGLAFGGCAVDLASKHWIFAKLGMPSGNRIVIVPPDIFCLETSLNEGALFGIGQGMAFVFAGLAVVAAIAITCWILIGSAGKDTWLTFALGCIVAGILGNLYDRLGLHGLIWPPSDQRAGQSAYAVRDWLHFQLRSINFDWAVFNIADSLLVVGAIMLFWHTVWREPRAMAAKQTTKTAPPSR
ncbi:MAG: signal peptidase II [Pirellulales bacterium]|nr:signal peptidase II [Pirellulales bacterium]